MNGSSVTIDRNRIFKVNGKPFFPIGARHIPAGADMKILKETGFNCFRWIAFGTDTAVVQKIELPRELEGMMFYAYIFDRGDFFERESGRKKELRDLITEIKDHPNFLCYEQRNEPSSHGRYHSRPQAMPEDVAQGSEYIRKLDSLHPIRIGHATHNLISTLKKYNPAADIIGCNPYVINHPEKRLFVGCRPDGRIIDSPNQTLSAVGDYTTKMMQAAEGMPVWMQLQAMANENWYNEAHTPEVEGAGIYEHHKISPSHWQMRFMFFNALIRGATAVEWALLGTEVNSGAWLEIRKTIGELNCLHDVLCAPAVESNEARIEYRELGFSDWTGIEFIVKELNGIRWIIAVNTQFDPAEAVFSQLPLKSAKQLEVFEENRTVEVRNGTFRDHFKPYEVHIYRSR